jgi:hypothetical protein
MHIVSQLPPILCPNQLHFPMRPKETKYAWLLAQVIFIFEAKRYTQISLE